MISDCVVCPRCRAPLDGTLSCGSCEQAYPRLNSLIVLLPDPAAHVEHWRMQLGLIIQQASETNRALQVQAAEPGVTGATRARLQALGRAIAEQVADVAAALAPAIGPPQPPHEGV